MASNRLLVIDDEPASSATIGRIARGCGYDTIITTDIDDFRSRICTWEPTVIVLDLAMPEMDGGELMAWLAKQGCKARILIVSGRATDQLQAAVEAGMVLGLNVEGSLQKPLRVEKLRSVFREIYVDAGVLSVQDMSRALANGEIRLLYQPQMDLRTGATVGFEALARWHHPRHGVLLPERFMPMTEAHAIINEFTSHTLEIALKDMRQWNNTRDCRVAVNVSAANFRTTSVDAMVEKQCAKTCVDCTRLAIEITETTAMTNTGKIGASLTRLHELGALISIDDFGTGYSSLVKLLQLPLSELKIDRSFVADCASNHQSNVLVRAMIDLAHNLNMKVVAEGVETEESMHWLRVWGCDIVQGYYVSKPMPPEAAQEWLSAHG